MNRLFLVALLLCSLLFGQYTGTILAQGVWKTLNTKGVSYEWLYSTSSGMYDQEYLGSAQYDESTKTYTVHARSEAQARSAGNATLAGDQFSDWDSQFFITWDGEDALEAGGQYRVSFQYKADNAVQTIGTQSQHAPRQYMHWQAIGNFNFTQEWTTYQSEVLTATADQTRNEYFNGYHTIAFLLSKGNENTYYFKDIVVEKLVITPTVTGVYNEVLHNGNTIRMRFNDWTNIPDLIAQSNSGNNYLLVPKSCVSVSVDGNAVPVASVLYDHLGQLYITVGEGYTLDGNHSVTVSFTNPDDEAYHLIYTHGINYGQGVGDLTNWLSTYDANLCPADVPKFWHTPDFTCYASAGTPVVTTPAPCEYGVYTVRARSLTEAQGAGDAVLTSYNDNPTLAAWDTQFFVTLGEENTLPAGAKLRVSFKCKADYDAAITTQAHREPGEYNHYYGIGDISVTGEWQCISREITVSEQQVTGVEGDGLRTVAFLLSDDEDANIYYFKDIEVEVKLPSYSYEYSFANNDLATEGWSTVNSHEYTQISHASNWCHDDDDYSFHFYYATQPQYLISKQLNATTPLLVSFWYKNLVGTDNLLYTETFRVGYSKTTSDVNAFTWGDEVVSKDSNWRQYKSAVPAGTKYVAVKLTSNDQFRIVMDDFVFTSDITLADGTPYHQSFDVKVPQATYKRTLGTERVGKHQGWMVPFDYTITAADEEYFQFYKISMIANSPAPGENSASDEMWVFLTNIGAGDVLHANMPYVYKPKTTVTGYEFTTENATLKARNNDVLAKSETLEDAYSFYAVYENITPASTDPFYYVSINGGISLGNNGHVTVGPNRWIIRKSSKYAAAPNYARQMRFFDGEETTGISEMRTEESGMRTVNEDMTNATLYSLDGRRLNGKPTKRGVYILNGRKVVVK